MLLRGGKVTEVGPRLRPYAGEPVIEAADRWLIPGLWDAHTHPVMWALARRRINLVGASGPRDTVERVRAHLADVPPGDGLVVGYGYRRGQWAERPTVAALDAVTGGRPVALASGDGHNGWLNSAALRLLDLPTPDGTLEEGEWYAAYARLEQHDPDACDPTEALRAAMEDAHGKGIVGIVDFEFGGAFRAWPEWVSQGLATLRVRASTYADGLEEVQAQGWRTGDRLVPGHDLVTMGPLKVISDGSLNTLTAWCCEPYVGGEHLAHPRGQANHDLDGLGQLMTRARDLGVTAAIHAIGDAALAQALDAFDLTGQHGSIEHAQLVTWRDVRRMAAAGLTASVQPAHVLDDREVSQRWWPDRTDRLYAFRALADAGVPLALGSDAPVSPLDPWLTIAAAVHRGADGTDPWHPEQALTAAEALAGSTDGQPSVGIGNRGDVVLLDADPLAAVADSGEHAAYLRRMPVAATVVAGQLVANPGGVVVD